MMRAHSVKAHWLLALPLGVYALSYLHLAIYHRKLWLWNTIVHEGGTHTLGDVILYASHFLGHLPSLTVIALLFTGFYLCLREPGSCGFSPTKLSLLIALLLAVSALISITRFGTQETLEFLLLKRQSVERLEAGGSWLLHLPSTLLMIVFLPVYLYGLLRMAGRSVRFSSRGGRYVLAGIVLCPLITLLVHPNPGFAFMHALTDPRYLAHAIRELATFPLTFFPLPLYFLLRNQPEASVSPSHPSPTMLLWVSALIFLAATLYMTITPLLVGISELAQAPAFARGGSLSIPYLLSSHYFEHFLDTIYFTLITLSFYSIANKKAGKQPASTKSDR